MRELRLARNTVVEMLRDRGYLTNQQTLTEAQFNSLFPTAASDPAVLNFVVTKGMRPRGRPATPAKRILEEPPQAISEKAKAQNGPTSSAEHSPETDDPNLSTPLAVHFTNDDKLGKAALEKLTSDYTAQGVHSLILITPAKMNPSCKVFIKSLSLVIEHFLLEELLFNISQHILVPRHRLLRKEEEAPLLARLMATPNNLATILTTDAMCRYIGGRPGEIVEIERPSKTAGTAWYYRVVKE